MTERAPLALAELARHHPVTGEEQMGARLVPLVGRQLLLVPERAPAPDHGKVRNHPPRLAAAGRPRGTEPPPIAPVPPRVPTRAPRPRYNIGGVDRAICVGGHEPGPEELPQRLERLGPGRAGGAR